MIVNGKYYNITYEWLKIIVDTCKIDFSTMSHPEVWHGFRKIFAKHAKYLEDHFPGYDNLDRAIEWAVQKLYSLMSTAKTTYDHILLGNLVIALEN